MRINKTDVIGMSDKELYDIYLIFKEEVEIRVSRRKDAYNKIENNMTIEEAENTIGATLYNKFLEEGKFFEVNDRVRLI